MEHAPNFRRRLQEDVLREQAGGDVVGWYTAILSPGKSPIEQPSCQSGQRLRVHAGERCHVGNRQAGRGEGEQYHDLLLAVGENICEVFEMRLNRCWDWQVPETRSRRECPLTDGEMSQIEEGCQEERQKRRVPAALDRKSTRLNSSHRTISYAVF